MLHLKKFENTNNNLLEIHEVLQELCDALELYDVDDISIFSDIESDIDLISNIRNFSFIKEKGIQISEFKVRIDMDLNDFDFKSTCDLHIDILNKLKLFSSKIETIGFETLEGYFTIDSIDGFIILAFRKI